MPKTWVELLKEYSTNQYRSRFSVGPIVESQPEIQSWFETELGQRILNQEQRVLDKILADFFGYHLMQLSVLNDKSLYDESPTSHQFCLSPCTNNAEDNTEKSLISGISSFEELAIDSDVIDVTLLHHVLDYSENPQQLLREAIRVTIPNGNIVVVGFNPFSLLGVKKNVACLVSSAQHWHYHQLRVSRIKDWFHVLGLDVLTCYRGDYGLPINRSYSAKMEAVGHSVLPWIGSFYILVARKTVTPMTLIKANWKNKQMIPRWRKGIAISSSHSSRQVVSSTVNSKEQKSL